MSKPVVIVQIFAVFGMMVAPYVAFSLFLLAQILFITVMVGCDIILSKLALKG